MDKRYRMLIDALDGTPRDVCRLLRPVSHTAATATQPDGSRLLDVVGEFTAHETAARSALECVLADEHPVLPVFNTAVIGVSPFDDVEAAIAAFVVERTRTTALLEALSQPQWLRTAVHPEIGALRLRTLVERLIAEDNRRLARIVDMRESLDRFS